MRGRRRRILPALFLAPTMLLAWIGALHTGADLIQSSPMQLPPSVVGQVIASVSTDELIAHICHLQDKDALGYCNTQGSRYSENAAGLGEAADYIAGQFQQYGLPVTAQTFTLAAHSFDQDPPAVLTNVIGTLEGVAPPTSRGTVIISAHYDSTASGAASGGPAPGADDNGSGVAAVLEAARLLSQRRFWHTVSFVTFAGEEQGLHGSRHYAEVAQDAGENIIGVLNADMIAYESDDDPRLEIHAGHLPQSAALADGLDNIIRDYSLELLPQIILGAATRASDHASFWDHGFPAVLVIEDSELAGPTDDFNPYYHTVDDTLDKIDRTYFAQMVQAVLGAVTRLARPVGPDLRVVQEGPIEVMPGQMVTVTLAYSNAGTASATGIVLTDTLSYGLVYDSDSSSFPRTFDAAGRVMWDVGEVDAGTGGTILLTATVLSSLQDGLSVGSRTAIAGRDLDADGADNVSLMEMTVRDRQRTYVPLVLAPGHSHRSATSH
ncbi:MAG: M20/M25/M40 family metallo-hydrolase [Anaerolineae bacterium]